MERHIAIAQGKGYGAYSIAREVKVVRALLKRAPKLAIDIGGNIGDYTAELRRSLPEVDVHVFEPSAKNVSILKERFFHDKSVTILPLAVSDATTHATLFADKSGSGLASLTKRKLDHFKIDFSFQEAVRTLRFEEYWIAQLGRGQVDVVKIDIEGHELAALQGFGDALCATGAIQFEFGGCNIDTRTYFQDFWYFFTDRGFDIYRIAPIGAERINRYRESDECFVTTNYVAVNNKQRS
jgi:FkbM family methyltransferase